MTEFLWRLPSRGDGRHARPRQRNRGGFGGPVPGTPATDLRPGRYGPFDDLAQIIDAAELAGLDGVLAPYDPDGEESWIVAGGALRGTRYSRVVVEFQPAFGTPVYAAKMSATLQRISGGRLAWRPAVDTDPADARTRGDRVTGDDRYARAAEFLTVARGVWNDAPVAAAGFAGTGFHYAGAHYDVIDGGFRGILSGLPFPTVYLSGDSAAALELSAQHGDVHVFTETAAGVRTAIGALRARAAAAGRTVRAGLELPVIARETEDEAWARVERQWREVHPDGPGAREHDLGDGRWSGFADLGYAASIGLVGSYAQVAHRLTSYAEAGVDSVVLSGHPHIEELHRAGEHLLFLADPVGRTLTAQEATA
ncbi:LLM class flavin-dependent oxidoreductase [Streptomyces gardneri]|uniref:LLM class flavin-dependent oxidoreductase n=1 Tax=Nocardia sputi TaxID=2943705 RepID=UPI0018944261|nr:LLM class flavin-dependent oxidoreductase [Nocardia sputi]MBF6166051.1 LLM class flavin-dependent oxidoreductase [Streptomyces gardneri]MBF6207126.1 LLM class flavin-dependent oxidoreductase [Streptomyces gardneri]